MLDELLLGARQDQPRSSQKIIDEQTEPWGIKVNVVEVKDVEIPTGMQRAMARQAEAERERRAKVISAEGEYQASTKLGEAAAVISQNPIALQLRYLQTLLEISGTNNSTTILPHPDRHSRGPESRKGRPRIDVRDETRSQASLSRRPGTLPAARGAGPNDADRRCVDLPVLRGARGDDAARGGRRSAGPHGAPADSPGWTVRVVPNKFPAIPRARRS